MVYALAEVNGDNIHPPEPLRLLALYAPQTVRDAAAEAAVVYLDGDGLVETVLFHEP